MTSLAAWAGILGPAVLAITISSLSIAQYGFIRSLGWDPLRAPSFDWPSGLALGPMGAFMTAAFIVCGGAMALEAWALGTELGTRSGIIGSRLLMLSGTALMGLAFTTDPTIRSTPATWHGSLHDLSGLLLGTSLIPGMITLGLAFHQQGPWKNLAVYSWVNAVLCTPALIVRGAAFYFFLLAALAWSEIVSFRLRSRQQ